VAPYLDLIVLAPLDQRVGLAPGVGSLRWVDRAGLHAVFGGDDVVVGLDVGLFHGGIIARIAGRGRRGIFPQYASLRVAYLTPVPLTLVAVQPQNSSPTAANTTKQHADLKDIVTPRLAAIALGQELKRHLSSRADRQAVPNDSSTPCMAHWYNVGTVKVNPFQQSRRPSPLRKFRWSHIGFISVPRFGPRPYSSDCRSLKRVHLRGATWASKRGSE